VAAGRSPSCALRAAPSQLIAASCRLQNSVIAATASTTASRSQTATGSISRAFGGATLEWPEAYAILTTAANDDVEPYHDRQMTVLRRDQRMEWLNHAVPEEVLLQPLPVGSFKVERLRVPVAQPASAF
jgi:putative SOS response-associated peptidase YedK